MRIVLRVEWVVDVFLYVWVVACVMVCAYVIVYAKGQVRENGSLVSVNAGFELDEGVRNRDKVMEGGGCSMMTLMRW